VSKILTPGFSLVEKPLIPNGFSHWPVYCVQSRVISWRTLWLEDFLPIAAVAVLVMGVGAARADFVNPGFETGDFSGWTLTGNSGFSSIVTSPVQPGNFAASFGPVGSLTFLSQTVSDTAGITYTVGGWLRNNGGTPTEFDIEVNGVTRLDLLNLPAQDYTQETATFVGTG
jgi:hypothetical protein